MGDQAMFLITVFPFTLSCCYHFNRYLQIGLLWGFPVISSRTAAANESQAGPQPRGPPIIKPRNIQTRKLMSWQRDQNRLRMWSTALGRKATETT